jgi:hypothetical protein
LANNGYYFFAFRKKCDRKKQQQVGLCVSRQKDRASPEVRVMVLTYVGMGIKGNLKPIVSIFIQFVQLLCNHSAISIVLNY